MKIERGISQRALDKMWLEYGGKIVHAKGGERRYVSIGGEMSEVYNGQRKDATAKLVTWARRFLHSAARSPLHGPDGP